MNNAFEILEFFRNMEFKDWLLLLGIFSFLMFVVLTIIRHMRNKAWELGYEAGVTKEKKCVILREITKWIVGTLEKEIGSGSWNGRDMEVEEDQRVDGIYICLHDLDRECCDELVRINLIISDKDGMIHIDSLDPRKPLVRTLDPQDPAIPNLIASILDQIKPKMISKK